MTRTLPQHGPRPLNKGSWKLEPFGETKTKKGSTSACVGSKIVVQIQLLIRHFPRFSYLAVTTVCSWPCLLESGKRACVGQTKADQSRTEDTKGPHQVWINKKKSPGQLLSWTKAKGSLGGWRHEGEGCFQDVWGAPWCFSRMLTQLFFLVFFCGFGSPPSSPIQDDDSWKQSSGHAYRRFVERQSQNQSQNNSWGPWRQSWDDVDAAQSGRDKKSWEEEPPASSAWRRASTPPPQPKHAQEETLADMQAGGTGGTGVAVAEKKEKRYGCGVNAQFFRCPVQPTRLWMYSVEVFPPCLGNAASMPNSSGVRATHTIMDVFG